MSATNPTLFIAWQDARSRRWFPIGRLRLLATGEYEFIYTQGYLSARDSGMQPIIGFDSPSQTYLSQELFPLFQNRLMSKSRDDYAEYLSRLGLAADSEPLVILGLTEGRRNTDSFVVFPSPIKVIGDEGEPRYRVTLFVHGVRYMPTASQERAAQLREGDPLWLMWDWQNPADPDAIMLRTDDNHLLGWIPRFYSSDLQRLRREAPAISVQVRRVNGPTSPFWSRVLCTVTAPWPQGFVPFADTPYRPLAPARQEH